MPTIEIASVDADPSDLDQKDFLVAIIVENKLESHRGLFHDLLSTQNGVMVHLGNEDLRNDKGSGFYAGSLVDDGPGTIIIPDLDLPIDQDRPGADQVFAFKFLPRYRNDIDKLLKIAIDRSSIKKVYLLSDYQFGPEKANYAIANSISELWELHDTHGLVYNTIYELHTP